MVNVHSFLLNQVIEDGGIMGFKLNIYLSYVVSSIICGCCDFLLGWDARKCQNLANPLNQNCFAFSQAINLNKLGIYFSYCYPEIL